MALNYKLVLLFIIASKLQTSKSWVKKA